MRHIYLLETKANNKKGCICNNDKAMRKNSVQHRQGLRWLLLLVFIAMTPALPSTAQTPLDETVVYERLMSRKNMDGYREGTPWDNSHKYKNTVEYDGMRAGWFTGGGCYGFMLDMMEYASNYEYPIRKIKGGSYDNLPEIHVGDGVRVDNDCHSVVVLEVDGSVITVAEANFNRSVHWGRKIDLSDPDEGYTYLATFWPEIPTGMLSYETDGSHRDVRIFNISGTLMKSVAQTGVPVNTLLRQLPRGVYIVKEGARTYKVFSQGR